MQRSSTIEPPLLLLLLGCVWGVGYSLARYVTTHGVSPVGYAFWQTLGPALLLSLFLICKGEAFEELKKHLLFFSVLGLFGIAIPNMIIYIIASHLPSGLVAVIVNTVPIFTYLLALLLKEESFRWLKNAAVLMCLVGLVLIQGHDVDWTYNGWVLLGLISPACFALSSVLTARFAPKALSPHALAVGMLSMACCWLIPWMVSRHGIYLPQQPLSWVDGAILLEIILSAAGYVIFFRLIRIAGSVYYSFVGGVVALVGLIWGWWMLGEHFTAQVVMGIGCVLVSLVMINRLQQRGG